MACFSPSDKINDCIRRMTSAEGVSYCSKVSCLTSSKERIERLARSNFPGSEKQASISAYCEVSNREGFKPSDDGWIPGDSHFDLARSSNTCADGRFRRKPHISKKQNGNAKLSIWKTECRKFARNTNVLFCCLLSLHRRPLFKKSCAG